MELVLCFKVSFGIGQGYIDTAVMVQNRKIWAYGKKIDTSALDFQEIRGISIIFFSICPN